MKNNLAEYGFDSNVGYTSYLDQRGAIYPEMDNSFEVPCVCLYHDHYDTEIPMLSAFMNDNANLVAESNEVIEDEPNDGEIISE
jgi:hypothetical protein